MTSKMMTSAFALAAVLAFGAIPVAASAHDEPVHPSTNTNSFNDNSTDVDTDVDKSFNTDSSVNTDNSVDNSVEDSFNSKVEDSNNDNREYKTDVDDSYNSKVEDSNNDNREYDGSFNTKVEDSGNTKVEDSGNTKVEDSGNTKVEDSYNSDSSTNDNSDNSTNNTEIRVALSLQDLDGSVSGFSFSIGGDEHHGGTLDTGDISNSGGAYAGFAGIQTASNNTGFAANNQAATAISANANVTFGNGGSH